jgi:hypothetical protein
MAAREQETTEAFIDSIQTLQKLQKTNTTDLIGARTALQEKQEELAYEEDSWMALVNIDRTGASPKEDYDPHWLQLVFGLVLLAIAGPILIILCSFITQIAHATIKSHAQRREFDKVMSWINPATAIADGSVAVACEIHGCDPNSAEMQKLRMIMMLTLNIIAALAMIAAGIALTIVTGGTAAPFVFMAVMGIIMGIIQLVCAIMEYKQAEKELELAEKRFVLNKILAVIEQIKMNLEIVSQDLDLLIEMFSSKMSDVREEYEKASRVLKEYNDTKRAIAQNIRS